METSESIILKINLSENQCEGRKWTKNLLRTGNASYACPDKVKIPPERLYPGMKAFIRLDGKLDYENLKFDKGLQIQCKVINSRKENNDPVDIQLVQTFDENNRINDLHLLSIGIDLTHGHR